MLESDCRNKNSAIDGIFKQITSLTLMLPFFCHFSPIPFNLILTFKKNMQLESNLNLKMLNYIYKKFND